MKKIILLCAMLTAAMLAAEPPLTDLIQLPSEILHRRRNDNLNKGKELYKLGEYRKSLPYLDNALLYSKALIKKAELQEAARKKLAEAEKLVKLAGSRLHQ